MLIRLSSKRLTTRRWLNISCFHFRVFVVSTPGFEKMATPYGKPPADATNLFKYVPEAPPNTPLLSVKNDQPISSDDSRAQDGDSLEVCHPSLIYSGSPRVSVSGEQDQSVGRSTEKHHRRTFSPSRPPNFLGLAVLVTLCNCPLGLLATIFACLSTGDYSRGDIDGARSKGQVSKWLSIIGFVSAVLIAVMVAMYFLVIERNIVRSYEELIEG